MYHNACYSHRYVLYLLLSLVSSPFHRLAEFYHRQTGQLYCLAGQLYCHLLSSFVPGWTLYTQQYQYTHIALAIVPSLLWLYNRLIQ